MIERFADEVMNKVEEGRMEKRKGLKSYINDLKRKLKIAEDALLLADEAIDLYAYPATSKEIKNTLQEIRK